MVKILKYCLILTSLYACNISVVKKDNNKYDFIIKNDHSSIDSTYTFPYLFGNTYSKKSNKNLHEISLKERTTYHRNGNVMSYRCYHKDKLLYYRIYNQKGATTKCKGRGILFEDSISYDTLDAGDSYLKTIHLVNPPNCKVIVMIGKYRPVELKNRDLNKFPVRMYDIHNSKVFYEVKSNGLSQTRYQIFWAIEDTINGKIQKGKIMHHFSFKPFKKQKKSTHQNH